MNEWMKVPWKKLRKRSDVPVDPGRSVLGTAFPGRWRGWCRPSRAPGRRTEPPGRGRSPPSGAASTTPTPAASAGWRGVPKTPWPPPPAAARARRCRGHRPSARALERQLFHPAGWSWRGWRSRRRIPAKRCLRSTSSSAAAPAAGPWSPTGSPASPRWTGKRIYGAKRGEHQPPLHLTVSTW